MKSFDRFFAERNGRYWVETAGEPTERRMNALFDAVAAYVQVIAREAQGQRTQRDDKVFKVLSAMIASGFDCAQWDVKTLRELAERVVDALEDDEDGGKR